MSAQFPPFDILYEDEILIAINKPPGILVHRTAISQDKRFVLQELRNQIGQRVFPVHRLDRGTSGVLLFAKNKEAASALGAQLRTKSIKKEYLAIVRGHPPDDGTIDYPLSKEAHKEARRAITRFKMLQKAVVEKAVGRYETARYSLLKLEPETGNRHQIRRHLAHLRHPIIGDKKHGDNKHNKFFKEYFGIGRLLLHASVLVFLHPISEKEVKIGAPLNVEFEKALLLLRISKP